MMPKAILIAAALALSAMSATARAEAGKDGGLAFGAHVSTLGLGAEGSVKLHDTLVLRLGGNYFAADFSDTLDGVSYSVDIELKSAGAALDLHPFANGFLLSGGVYWNGNGADFKATPASNITIGGTSFTPAQIGTLDGKLEFNAVAPYAGIGYDSAHYADGPFSFHLRAGLFYMGDADVTLTATGTSAGLSAFQSELAREADNIEDEFDILGFYPAITIGFSYRF